MEDRSIQKASVAALLRRVPVFASLEDQHVEQLSAQVMRHEVTKGEFITVEGQVAEGLYIVAAGQFKRFKTSSAGHEQILKFFQAGESFGQVHLLDGGPDPASTQAMEPSVLYVLPRSRSEARSVTSTGSPSQIWLRPRGQRERW